MASVRITHRFNLGAVVAMGQANWRIYRDTQRRGIRVQGAIRRCVRVDTGRLRSSYAMTGPVFRAGVAGVRVGSNLEYAIYQNNGTRWITGDHCLEQSLSAARY